MIDVHDLLPYLHIFNKCSSTFAILFNSFLIYLILTKSPKQLGVYKYLMVFISVFEILYSILEVSLVPIHFSYRSSVVVLISTSDKPFSRHILLILDSFYWGFFGSSLAIFAVHFIYRYLVISGNPLLRTFQSWKMILWMLIPVVIGIMWAMTGIYLCGPTEEFTEFMRKPVREVFNENIEEFEYLGAFMYEISSNHGNPLVYWRPISGMIIMSMTVFASFVVIVVCGFKCYSRIKLLTTNASTTSSRSQALQSQLFNALVIQTMIPMLLLHTPVSLKFGFAIFDSGLGAYCFIMSMTIALYPAIDPLPNFFIISSYRKAARGIFKVRPHFPQLRKKRQAITANNSSQRASITIPKAISGRIES